MVDELDVVGVAVDVGGVEGEEAAFGVGERAGDDVGVVDLVANFVLVAVTLDGAATEARRAGPRGVGSKTLTDDSSSGDY